MLCQERVAGQLGDNFQVRLELSPDTRVAVTAHLEVEILDVCPITAQVLGSQFPIPPLKISPNFWKGPAIPLRCHLNPPCQCPAVPVMWSFSFLSFLPSLQRHPGALRGVVFSPGSLTPPPPRPIHQVPYLD